MKLQLKRSNVLTSGAAKVPTASQLEYGELAINYNDTDPAIFLKDSNNNVIRISGVGNIADDGQVELPASTTPPLNPEAGNLWFNSDEGRLYIYYVDTDTSQWVDASPDSYDPSVVPDMSDPNYQAGTLDDRYNSSQVGTTAPAVTTRQEGALWWNSNNNEGKLYVLYNDPAPDGRKKWVEASPYPDTSGFIRSNDNGTQQNIIGGGGLTIDGNVGIGTLSPAGALHVDAVSGVDGPVFDSGGTANANHALLVRDSANNQLLRVNNNGNIGIGTTSPGALLDLGTATPILRFSDTDTTGYHQIQSSNANFIINADPSNATANSSISFNVDGDERMRINSSGNVGIGNTNPQHALVIGSGTDDALNVDTQAAGGGVVLRSYDDGTTDYEPFGIAAEYINFYTRTAVNSSAERMRIDSSGLVGIGRVPNSSLTGYPLQIKSDTDDGSLLHLSRLSDGVTTANDGFLVGLGSVGTSYVWNREPEDLIFGNSNTERMRINSAGLVMIGTTTEGFGNGADNLTIADTGNCGITIRSTSSTVGSIYFSDGTSGTAEYEGYIEYAHNTNALRFATAATERMRIDSLGNLGIGTASPYVAAWGVAAKQVNITGTDYGVLHLTSSSLGTTWSHGAGGTGSINYLAYDGSNHWLTIAPNGITKMQGAYNYATSSAANVHVTPTGQFYRSTSSIKYKTDVETLEDQYADAILKCRPVWYRSVCDGDIVDKSRNKSEFGYYGFIAEEVADIDPRLVSWKTKKDVKNDDNWELKEVHLDPSDYEAEGVNYTNFIPLLLNLLKRQKTELQTLKEKVAALEAQ